MTDQIRQAETNVDVEQILTNAGKALRHTCRIVIFLENHSGEKFNDTQIASATGLSIDQVRSSLCQLANKQKITRIRGTRQSGKAVTVYTNNEKIPRNKRQHAVKPKTSAARLSHKGAPPSMIRFAKYLDPKLAALDHAIEHCESEGDRDMLIRMRGDYESLRAVVRVAS